MNGGKQCVCFLSTSLHIPIAWQRTELFGCTGALCSFCIVPRGAGRNLYIGCRGLITLPNMPQLNFTVAAS